MKTSIRGNHMDTCVWSNDAATEGVDTCVSNFGLQKGSTQHYEYIL